MESIEFLEIGSQQKACVQFLIETKKFRRFKNKFETDKWMSIAQWEEISHILTKKAKNFKNDLSESFEKISEDDELLIKAKFLPKNESYVDFSKLKFEYTLDWFLSVEISKVTTSRKSRSSDKSLAPPEKLPEVKSENIKSETYSPTYSPKHTSSTQYTPKAKSDPTTHLRSPPEYIPQPLASPDQMLLNTYTATPKTVKPEPVETRSARLQSSRLQLQCFGESDVESSSHSSNVTLRTKKRSPEYREQRSDPEVKKPKTSSVRSHKKIKNNDQQPKLDGWMSTSKASKENSTRKTEPEKQISKLDDVFDDKTMNEMNKFLERAYKSERDSEQRRHELKDLEILDCLDMEDSELKRMVSNFMPEIRALYEKKLNKKENPGYNPVLITTAKVLDDRQLSYVCRQIEALRDLEDRGHQVEVLTEKVLPEFIIHVFCQRFNFSKEDALKRLEMQEERRSLYGHDDSF